MPPASSGLALQLPVTEAVLGHSGGSRGGIVGIYQRHDYAEEKASALEAWGAHVMALVEGSVRRKVLPIGLGVRWAPLALGSKCRPGKHSARPGQRRASGPYALPPCYPSQASKPCVSREALCLSSMPCWLSGQETRSAR